MATSKVLQFLVGKSNKGKYPAVCGSELSVNMYRGDNNGVTFQESCTGIKSVQTITGRCRGSYVSTTGLSSEHSKEDMFAVFGNVLYRITETGKQKIFTVAPNGRRVSFAETGGMVPYMLVADGANLFWYSLQDGRWGKIQLPQSMEADSHTIKPTHVAVVNGTVVVNDIDSGYCYYSYRYPLATDTREVFDLDNGNVQYESDNITVKMKTVDSFDWVFLDDYGVPMFFSTVSSSDSVNGLCAVGAYLYVFGPKSIEIKSYLGQENNTWSDLYFSVQSSIGLESPDSLCTIGNTVFFVSTGQQRGKTVMSITGTNFEPVSENWLEEKLESESTSSSFGFTYATGHHQFVVMQLETLRETWVYDISTGEWHQRTSRNPNSGLETQWRGSSAAYWHQKMWVFTKDGMVGKLEGFTEDYVGGVTLPVIRHRQSPVFVSDNRPFVIEELALECNVGCNEDYKEDPEVLLEVSKDGGMTFGNTRSTKFGRTGQYSHRVRFHALGMVRQCVLKVTFSEPMDFVLTDADVRAGRTMAMI